MNKNNPKNIVNKEKIVLKGLKEFNNDNGYMPTIRELLDKVNELGLNIKSTRSVFNYLDKLEKQNYISRKRKKRGIKLKPKAKAERKCNYCKWFEPINKREGRCHRYPPQKEFPMVKIHDYCGEFKNNLYSQH